MQRAKKIFEGQGIVVQTYPVDFKSYDIKKSFSKPLDWFPSSNSLGKSSIAIREIIGRIIYRAWRF